MPNQYKEKECPNCGELHRKRGVYCGQSCANSNQKKTTEHVRKIKKSIANYQNSPEGIANAQRQSQRASAMRNDGPMPVSIDEFAVGIPDITDFSDIDLDGRDIAADW